MPTEPSRAGLPPPCGNQNRKSRFGDPVRRPTIKTSRPAGSREWVDQAGNSDFSYPSRIWTAPGGMSGLGFTSIPHSVALIDYIRQVPHAIPQNCLFRLDL